MALTRRSFVKDGAGSCGGARLVSASSAAALRAGPRGLLAGPRRARCRPPRPLLLHNNENPLGPGQAVLEAVRGGARRTAGPPAAIRARTCRRAPQGDRRAFGARPENVALGCGSTQILRVGRAGVHLAGPAAGDGVPDLRGVRGLRRPDRHPGARDPARRALQLDLDAMAEAAKGAGLVFLNNPNNPTGTLWPAGRGGRRSSSKVLAACQEAVVLIDEAYHDYVTDPAPPHPGRARASRTRA